MKKEVKYVQLINTENLFQPPNENRNLKNKTNGEKRGNFNLLK